MLRHQVARLIMADGALRQYYAARQAARGGKRGALRAASGDAGPIVAYLSELVAGALPGSGDYMAARDSGRYGREMLDSIAAGDYGKAASDGLMSLVAGAGALPMVPYLAGLGTKAVKALPMDEVKNLVAHHNIKPDGLKMADQAGGLPMPSLAVSRVEYPMAKFGQITLLADPSMVTPSRTTSIWPNDAYTGRQPRASIHIADAKAWKSAIDADPNFSTIKDRSYAYDMYSDLSDFDRDLRTVNAAINSNGVDPSKFDNFYDLKNAARRALGYGADADIAIEKAAGVSHYGGTRAMLERGFTESGNRRKPLPYTAENVLKEMTREGSGRAAAETFQYGPPLVPR